MKRQSIFAAFAAVAAGSLFSAGAKATITDNLTGPNPDDPVVSALTADPGTDGRGNANPYVSSNSGRSFGNSRFGAGYNAYSYTGVFTNGSAEGYQSLTATATAFGETKTALNSYLYAVTNGPNQSANVYGYVYALGSLVKSGTHAGGDFNGTTYLTGWNQDLWSSGSQTFYISIVPVTVGVTVKGSANQNLWGHVWVDGVNAHLNQGAYLSATAFGGIGPSWANAGIKVNNLALMNASLSLNSTAQFQMGGEPCSANATVGATYGLYLRELSGEIDLYASANLIFHTFSDDYKIASWPGFSQQYNIIDYAPSTQSYGSVACFDVPAAPQVQGIIIG